MSASIYITLLRVIPSEGDPDPPMGNLVARFGTTSVSHTTGSIRTAVRVDLSASNNLSDTLQIPFAWTTTNDPGTVRGADWRLYGTATPGTGNIYLGDTFDVPIDASSATLYVESFLTTGLTADIALTLETPGGGGSDLPVGGEIGFPNVADIVLNGLPATATIDFPVTADTAGEHETITAIARIAPAVPSGGGSIDVTRAGIAYTTEYTATYVVFAGAAQTSSGNLGAGATTTIALAEGDDSIEFYLAGVQDETTDGDGDVTLTLDTPVAILVGASPNDVFTGTFEDTSRSAAVIQWELISQQPFVAEPTTASDDYALGFVQISGSDELNAVSAEVGVVAGTATELVDFTLLTTSVTWAAGETDPIPVWVRVTGTDNFEFSETVTLRISNVTTSGPSPRLINPHTVNTDNQDFTFTITNTDPAPEMQFETGSVTRTGTGLFNVPVRMNNLSNLDHTVTVSAPVLGGGAVAGDITPPGPTDLFFPAGTTQQRLFTYTIANQPQPGGTDWTARFSLSVLPTDGATLGANVDFVVTVEAPAAIEPTIGFRSPSASWVEDGLIHNATLEIANDQTLDAGSWIEVTLEQVTPTGVQAIRGTDWDIVVSDTDSTVVPADTSSGAPRWLYTMTQGVDGGQAQVYYIVYDETPDEDIEAFRLQIVGVVGFNTTQTPEIAATNTHQVNITDSNPSETGEALHGLAPLRQYYDPADPDIIVRKNGGNTGGVIVWKRYPARQIPSDFWAESSPGAGGTTQFAYGPGDSGVALAIRFARHIWALKNAGRVSGYVNPWTGALQVDSGMDDLAWLQTIDNMPTEGMNPVTIFLDGSLGTQDFHSQFDVGAVKLTLNTRSDNSSNFVCWDAALGLPHIRDLIIYGSGRDVTTAPAHRYSNGAGRTNVPGFPFIPADYGGFGFPAENSIVDWTARADNIRWEKVAIKFRDYGNANLDLNPNNNDVCMLNSNGTQNHLLKFYDCDMYGKETAYTNGAELHMKWGVNAAGTSMPDYRNCEFRSCSEHSWYQKAARPHGWYIDCWQHWRGNGGPANSNAAQFSRHVDRGFGHSDGQQYYSGGLENSLLLNLRCHGRNNGYNHALGRSVPGDSTVKWEGFDGTVIQRDCIVTGRFGRGPVGSGGESDTSAMKIAFRPVDGRHIRGQAPSNAWLSINGCPLFDYGDEAGVDSRQVEFQAWPMGHPHGAIVGHFENMVATSALTHTGGTTRPADPEDPDDRGIPNGTPGSRYYPMEVSQPTGQSDRNPVAFQAWGPNWWHFRKIILWNTTVRQDEAPADGSGSDKDLFILAGGAREVVIRVDSTITATAPNGGVDYAGNPIGTREPITGTIRMLGTGVGQELAQMSVRPFLDAPNDFGNGLWTWELAGGGEVWDDPFWDNAAHASGPRMRHGIDAAEHDDSQATGPNILTLTEAGLNAYDGDDPT